MREPIELQRDVERDVEQGLGIEKSVAERILKIVRAALERGQSVEIEGLGSFRSGAAGQLEFVPESKPQVFIAYVEEDLATVRRLSDALSAADCSSWLDKDQLLAGQNWPRAIERAIDTSQAFVACFSPRSIAKRGQFQSELRYALDCARRLPLEAPFLIPVRLENCPVPRVISDQVQYVDLFPNWDRGLQRLVRSIRRAAKAQPKPAAKVRL